MMGEIKGLPVPFLIFVCVLITIVIIYAIRNNMNVKFGKLSIEREKKLERENEDKNVRIKLAAQIREYENYTGKIERMIYYAFEQEFPNLTRDEKTVCKLSCNVIRHSLEKQLSLDIIANHISTKDRNELREYTHNKTLAYQNRIMNFLSDFNEIILPGKNVLRIMKRLNMQKIEGTFFAIYVRAVEIANS